MLRIRLSMGGVRKRPVYKIVIADSRYPRDGKFIEKIGSYNPLLPKDKKERIKVEAERVKYWMSKGAQPTMRVSRLLGEVQLMPMPKPGNNPQKAIPKKDRKKVEGDKKEETKKDAPAADGKKPDQKADAKKEEPKKEQPKAEAKKEEPKKEEPKKEQPKAEAKKEEPKKEEPKKEQPKAEAKKEEPKKEEPKKEQPNAEAKKEEPKKEEKRLNQKVIRDVRGKNFYFISRSISWTFRYRDI